MTIARRMRACAPEEPRADRFNDSARLPKEVCSAGSVPASRPTPSAMAPANASTRRSSVTSAVKGSDSDSSGVASANQQAGDGDSRNASHEDRAPGSR